jgi:hypothetical protein
MTTLRRPPEATPSFRPATAGRKSAPGRLKHSPISERAYYGDQLSSAGGVIFLRTGSSLWKTFTVSAQTTHQVVAVNLRYGDIDQNNIIQVQASAPFSGDSAVWNNALTGKVLMTDPLIYKFDHRADVDRNFVVSQADNSMLQLCNSGTGNAGDVLQ